MQSSDQKPAGHPRLRRFLQNWLINTLAVLVTVKILPGIHFTDHSVLTPFLTALVLGVVNSFIRPIVMLLTLPFLLLTLGLFLLVINAAMLMLVSWLLPQFEVDTFGWALLGALIISVISAPLNLLTRSGKGKITFHRQQRPPDSGSDTGSGPVIDV